MNRIPPVEFGFSLCRLPTGQLTRGPAGLGTATGVQFSDRCPAGSRLLALVHSHPKSGGGSPLPSRQDLREQARTKAPLQCIITTEKSSCYRPKGR